MQNFTLYIYNPIYNFVSNTSHHAKAYAWLVGVTTSFYLSYQSSSKTAPLIGRCVSLFMAGDLLHSQLDLSWGKIAVTAIKTISISIGIAGVALSSSTLLATSLLCDLVGQLGHLGVIAIETNLDDIQNEQQFIHTLIMLLSNCLILAAITTASPDLLILSSLLSVLSYYIGLRLTASQSPDSLATILNVLNFIVPCILGFNQLALYTDSIYDENMQLIVPPINFSTVGRASEFAIPINFRFDIFSEWAQTTE